MIDYDNLIDRTEQFVDFEKPVRTRGDKIPVKLLCQFFGSKGVIGYIGDNKEYTSWKSNGHYGSYACGGHFDLENYDA